MTAEERRQLAEEYFTRGYNCAQAVALAFCDLTGMKEETTAALASSFGGGIGRLREVCGSVSGAVMVLGALYGTYRLDDHDAKALHYERVREVVEAFRAQNGSIICRELLAGVGATTGGAPAARTEAYYQKRPCRELVGLSAANLQRYIDAHPITKGE